MVAEGITIAVACISLITNVSALILATRGFSAKIGDAKNDMNRVLGELLSVEMVLERLRVEDERSHKSFPDTIQQRVHSVVAACDGVISELQKCLEKYKNSNFRYAISGRDEVLKLRSNLEAHKSALEILLHFQSANLARATKNDTRKILGNTTEIPKIRAEIAELRICVERLEKDKGGSGQSGIALKRYLEEVTTYTESGFDSTIEMRKDWKDTTSLSSWETPATKSSPKSKEHSSKKSPSKRPQNHGPRIPRDTPIRTSTSFSSFSTFTSQRESTSPSDLVDNFPMSLEKELGGIDVKEWEKRKDKKRTKQTRDENKALQITETHAPITGEVRVQENIASHAASSAREFTHIRYTWGMEPPQVMGRHFRLRQTTGPPSLLERRPTCLLISLDLSDELGWNSAEFAASWNSIGSAIKHLVQRDGRLNLKGNVSEWWKNVVVFVFAPFYNKPNKELSTVLGTLCHLGVLDPSSLRKGQELCLTQAYLFEYSTPFSTFRAKEGRHEKCGTDPDVPGIQMVLCLSKRREDSFSKWNQVIKGDLVPFHDLVIRKPGETVGLDGINWLVEGIHPPIIREVPVEKDIVSRAVSSTMEFTHLRHTVVTEPPQVMGRHFQLRQTMGPPNFLERRQTRLLISLDLSGELEWDSIDFIASWNSISSAIKHLVQRDSRLVNPKGKGSDWWKNVVVFVFYAPFYNKPTKGLTTILMTLISLGLLGPSSLVKEQESHLTRARLFEYSTPFSVLRARENGVGKRCTDPDMPGIQVVLCLSRRREDSFNKWNQMVKNNLVPFHNLEIRKPGEKVDLDDIDSLVGGHQI